MIRYRILPEHMLVVFCVKGTVEPGEIAALGERLWQDPDFSADFDALVDDTYVEHALSGDQIRELVERRSPNLDPDSKLAVVAPADVTYGVSRMHQLMSEHRRPLNIEVFRDRAAALAWLGKEDLDVGALCEELSRD